MGCKKAESVTNCQVYTSNGIQNGCYNCQSNYVVANSGLACTAFTTDSNCRTLNKGGTCHSCWHSYYWNTNSCKLKSINLYNIKIFTLGLIIIYFILGNLY